MFDSFIPFYSSSYLIFFSFCFECDRSLIRYNISNESGVRLNVI